MAEAGFITYAELCDLLSHAREGVVDVITFGSPLDPFVRMTDSVRIENGELLITRRVLARGYVESIEVPIRFVTPDHDAVVYAVLDGVAALFGGAT